MKASYDQDTLADICADHPTLAKEYFIKVWKPFDQKTIDRKIRTTTSPLWKEISDCITTKTETKVALKASK